MAKKEPKKNQKKIDVKHDFEAIVSMTMFNIFDPTEDKKPEPYFKEKHIVQKIAEPGILYEIRVSKWVKDKFKYLLANLENGKKAEAFENEIEYPKGKN